MNAAPLVTRLDPIALRSLVRRALREDIGRGDITTALVISPDAEGSARIVTRGPIVVAGLDAAGLAFEETGGDRITWSPRCDEGDPLSPGAVIADIDGSLASILTAERPALNLLAHCCSIASYAARLARIVEGTPARVVDTRKTTPGLRVLDKYAVRVGGCFNHRFGLDDGILIKENHVKAAGGIAPAVERAKAGAPHGLKIEVEVEDLDQLDDALTAGADAVLLDNMPSEMVAEAVTRAGGKAVLESSGGITEQNLRAYAETGVDLISLGALTHSAPYVDLSLEVS